MRIPLFTAVSLAALASLAAGGAQAGTAFAGIAQGAMAAPAISALIAEALTSPGTGVFAIAGSNETAGDDARAGFRPYLEPDARAAAPSDSVTTAFTPRGADISSIVSDGPTSIAPAVVTSFVPEPATWALMTVGFGGLGALLRRRRRTAFAAV